MDGKCKQWDKGFQGDADPEPQLEESECRFGERTVMFVWETEWMKVMGCSTYSESELGAAQGQE